MSRELMCFTHNDRAAPHRCRTCQKPVCEECVKKDANGTFCSFACSEKAKDFGTKETGAVVESPGGGLKKVIITVLVVAVIGVGGLYAGAKVFKVSACQKIVKKLGLP